jgi:thiosulfate/3-mercaptopyruvate sulfurtransferase
MKNTLSKFALTRRSPGLYSESCSASTNGAPTNIPQLTSPGNPEHDLDAAVLTPLLSIQSQIRTGRDRPLNIRNLRINFAVSLLAICAPYGVSVQAQQAAASTPAQTDATIPAQAMLQPAELVQMLNTSAKPLVLQTGSHVLYAEAHIPGSEYAGPAGTSAGIEALRARVTGLNKDTLIVIYCGCCPWSRCPNIKPAYQQLQSLGFTNVRALYIEQNFGTDWVDKGYPVAKGR